MVFDHKVKYKGVWYLPGQEVPVDSVKTPHEEKAHSYSRSEIARMNTADLKVLAKESGIAEADTMTGADIKKALIEMFNL